MNLTVLLNKFRDVVQPLRQRFEALPATDKRAVVIMLLAIAAFVSYLLISSTATYQRKSIVFYKDAREDLRWINLNLAQLKQLSGTQISAVTSAASDDSLIAVATSTAKTLGISFKRFQPEGDTGLRLWIEAAEFDRLLQWVDVLTKQGIILEQLDVDKLEKQVGMVDARVLIRRE